MTRKVIIVGPKVVSDFLKSEYADWDTQIPCANISDLWNGLDTDEISQETEIILIVDALFNETPDAFAEVVATFAPHALVMVLSYDLEASIRTRVANFAEKELIPAAPFHFIRAEIALHNIEDTIRQHDHANDEPKYTQ